MRALVLLEVFDDLSAGQALMLLLIGSGGARLLRRNADGLGGLGLGRFGGIGCLCRDGGYGQRGGQDALACEDLVHVLLPGMQADAARCVSLMDASFPCRHSIVSIPMEKPVIRQCSVAAAERMLSGILPICQHWYDK